MGNVAGYVIALGLLPLAGYLVGSVPFGYLVGRLRGVDIRQHGSRNIGATNAMRVLGRPWGLLVFALDVLKGVAPVLTAGLWLRSAAAPDGLAGPTLYAVWLVTAFAAIAGHIWPVWLGFKGGKGVATSLGVVLAVYPFFTWPGLAALAVWIAVTLGTRYVSLGSICAALAFPLVLITLSLGVGGRWATANTWPLLAFAMLMPMLVIWRHRANLGRLLAGTENKIGQPKANRSPASPPDAGAPSGPDATE